MIQPQVLKFLKSLEKNNNKPWMDAHRSEYETAKKLFNEFAENIKNEIAKFDDSIAALKISECTFRINRDIRFSKDKRPYKNNMGAFFNKYGKKHPGAGYYVHIEPGNCFAAAGIWKPEKDALNKIRQEIDYNIKAWKNIMVEKSLNKEFKTGLDCTDTLIKIPKGYDEDNEAGIYLKLKSFIVQKEFSDKEVTDKSFVTALKKSFLSAKPMLDFINQSFE